MNGPRILAVATASVAVVFAGITVTALRTPSSPLDRASESVPVRMEGGAYIQRLGDCVACHSVPKGAPFAGGLKMETPLGAIYSTNITPDRETGIGNYTLAEFDNAVRRGVARDGHRLYPAMPYPSYAKISDDDIRKLYDYFMHTARPVRQENRVPDIPPLLRVRWPLALWNWVFVNDARYVVKPEQDAVWNRGAYLVQGLGHCGSCHTPRGIAFQEKGLDESSTAYLSGAVLDGWYASNLRGDAKGGLGNWSEADIVSFLRTGRNAHAAVYGSMLEVFNNSTQFMSDADLNAVARYLKSLPPNGALAVPSRADSNTTTAFEQSNFSAPGSAIYMERCASCHAANGGGRGGLLAPLAANSSITGADAASLINVILNGSPAPVVDGMPGSYRMPAFRVILSDQEIADVATFVRTGWGNDSSPVTSNQVRALRGSTRKADIRSYSLPTN